MINTPYVKKDSVSNYFPVPNAVFDLELHHIEIDMQHIDGMIKVGKFFSQFPPTQSLCMK